MPGFPFPTDPVLTGIVVAYKNGDYIADEVLPRLDPLLPKQLFKYSKFDFTQQLTLPDTKVGRKSAPTVVEFAATDQPASTFDYGLDDIIPTDDIKNAPAGYDPAKFASQKLMDLVLLDREVRTANLVFAQATYPAANKVTLSGTSQWSDATSDPIAAIQDAADTMPMRPNIGVIGQAAWTKLRRNPKIIAAISFSGTSSGVASRRAVAELLELDDILVGSAWLNSAKPGQAVSRVRAWGKHFALLRREKLASSIDQMPTFGWTAQYGGKVSGQIDEPKTGLRGSVRVRAGESVAEVIAANDLGYLFTNAVA